MTLAFEVRTDPHDVCDFCSDEKTKRNIFTSFECKDFAVKDVPADSKGGWCACEPCAELIYAEKWDELAERSINTLPWIHTLTKDEYAALLGFVKMMHQQFREGKAPERMQ